MRVLFFTLPAYGHFHPMVPYARALRAAGHEVSFACTEPFNAVIEGTGLPCISLGSLERPPMPTRDWQDDTAWDREAPENHSTVIWAFRNIFAGQVMRDTAERLVDVVAAWQPDLVVRETAALAGAVAADRAGIPHATAGPSGFRTPEWTQEVIGEQITELWAEHGLAVSRPVWELLYRYLDLVSAPPGFLIDRDARRPVSRYFNADVFDQTGDEGLPPWFETLPDRPIVYATLGTGVFNRYPGVFESIIDALSPENITLVLTVGRNQNPEDFDPDRENVFVERYIPQSRLFPACDAVVTHGGWNTVTAALSFGLPTVVVPLGADQGENALRVEAYGAGRIVWPEERTSDAIRSAMREVLADSGFKTHAKRYQQELKALPGLEAAVKTMEELVATGRPVSG